MRLSEPSLYKNVILLIHLATRCPDAVAYGWVKKSNSVYLAGLPLIHPA